MKSVLLITLICFSCIPTIQATSSFTDLLTGFVYGARKVPLTSPNTCVNMFSTLSAGYESWMTALETPSQLGVAIYKMRDFSALLVQVTTVCGFQSYYNQLTNMLINNPSVISARTVLNLNDIQNSITFLNSAYSNGLYQQVGTYIGQIIYLGSSVKLA